MGWNIITGYKIERQHASKLPEQFSHQLNNIKFMNSKDIVSFVYILQRIATHFIEIYP